MITHSPPAPAHGPASQSNEAENPIHTDEPVVFTKGHHFNLAAFGDLETIAAGASGPLSVILQVTKRCNFDCSFCSETLQEPDPTLATLGRVRDNLVGVPRVFLSGGEPLLRRDIVDIVDMFAGTVIGLPTNATRGLQQARHLAGKVTFVTVGLEGPRSTTNRVRGDYDRIMAGVRAFQDAGLPLSLSAVVYRSTLTALPFTLQIADVLDAGKLKLILPLRKGNALDLADHEFLTVQEATAAFERLAELRTVNDWRPALRLTTWTPDTEGHMIVISPRGLASAWPVYDAPDLLEPLGNLLDEPISAIWARYRFKRNHYAKYLGHTIHSASRTERPPAARHPLRITHA
ncbi:putative Fe-S oxidoreductase [Frankia sp. CcI6]|uniref:radical SAM protein n=1 Tax=unclassified Frankia TaxID=2632575 RepID=UPI0003CFB914|nr:MULTISPECIES: radical SAM protein [unclassified Frankia]ETA01235.1 putative Fe-S oxidoreductase [Frankia sp. CcI6]OFB42219.1 radical SAM protein [Frankia sp. CgIM4]OHV52801.1 radical SAM protein [Frankia sp. CgIS1]